MADKCTCTDCPDCKGSGGLWLSPDGSIGGKHWDDLEELVCCEHCGGDGVVDCCDYCHEQHELEELEREEQERR
ncbi:hypothetical protein [uncultured Paraglaciecola sp.]|uniref:hypothetical protein n=1 Tax=uncultured Paraglaciecola sp. TaxID=1765024 RepID=UPI00262A0B30|nr:hypothetical protein [uncultured Paraglaciecola sp.]